ncbi:MAG: HflX GTPase family protein [Romboutsia sp.]|uniref:HflX GTPase family protein n=1 Tax=Romboutsia sp. TaxID=1965302 RepID=UPI003F3566D9
MTKPILLEKRAILIAVKTQLEKDIDILNSIEELKELSRLCKIETVDCMIQRMEKINFYHYIGKGKIEELKEKINKLEIDIVVVDSELANVQIKNLGEELGIKVIDRTAIILDVFYQAAKTKETKLLFEIAKLRYRILRCNEDKKELLKEKLNYLQKELNEIDKHYEILKENRRKSTIPVVAIVGYSNVGKSSILNILAHENIYVEDKLFATMDPTTRLVTLPSKGEVLFTDTVGFIRKLPNNLLNLFHISIAEIKNADVVIHAIDISAKDFNEKKQVVDDTLDYLGIDKSKIIQVFNKIDLVDDINSENEEYILMSIKENIGVDRLLIAVESMLRSRLENIELLIPYKNTDILATIYANGEDISEDYKEFGVYVKGYIKKEKLYLVKKYFVKK